MRPVHLPDLSLVFLVLEEDFSHDALLGHVAMRSEPLAQAACASVDIWVAVLLEDLAPSATPGHPCSVLSCRHSHYHQVQRLPWENPREHLPQLTTYFIPDSDSFMG